MKQSSNSKEQPAPWLTMLHGFSQNASVFEAQKRHFEGSYRVFCPELLGHGARDIETLDYSVPAHAKDVLNQMRERGIDRTHFWGTHTGTSVGLCLAFEYPTPLPRSSWGRPVPARLNCARHHRGIAARFLRILPMCPAYGPALWLGAVCRSMLR